MGGARFFAENLGGGLENIFHNEFQKGFKLYFKHILSSFGKGSVNFIKIEAHIRKNRKNLRGGVEF